MVGCEGPYECFHLVARGYWTSLFYFSGCLSLFLVLVFQPDLFEFSSQNPEYWYWSCRVAHKHRCIHPEPRSIEVPRRNEGTENREQDVKHVS
jgi:hypothetical protein